MSPSSILSKLAAILGLTAVAAGAFGAHALKDKIPPLLPGDLEIWKTAALYHLVHALLLAWLSHRIAQLPPESRPGALVPSAWAFVAGILIFSGSLYALVLLQIRWLGAITPIGGLCLMAGWLLLAFAPKSIAKESARVQH